MKCKHSRVCPAVMECTVSVCYLWHFWQSSVPRWPLPWEHDPLEHQDRTRSTSRPAHNINHKTQEDQQEAKRHDAQGSRGAVQAAVSTPWCSLRPITGQTLQVFCYTAQNDSANSQTNKKNNKQAAAGRTHPGAQSRLEKLCDLRSSEPSISVTVSGKQQ